MASSLVKRCLYLALLTLPGCSSLTPILAPPIPSTPNAAPAVVVTPPHSAALITPPPAACVAKLFETTCYLPPRESDHLRAALDFAAAAHDGQRRKSGEAFIIHPVEVATILAELRMDCNTIVAGLLHDTIEDTPVTLGDVQGCFGPDVASIVASVTDSKALPDRLNQKNQLKAMAQDWRIVILKLADRLHNMRTLQHMPRCKQQRKAIDTIELYVPLARCLGVREIEQELLESSTEYLFPRLTAVLACLNLREKATPFLARCARWRWPTALEALGGQSVRCQRASWAAHRADYLPSMN
uniref:HD domain-containing protein n=1 Tax=Haptolina ericina TaxID=156174 RepID=A0A7S3AMS2_9EUKA|mmetsp:Transcript_24005/g.54581  ORF Transcript_24005/g.54581 Transcript_24005/m.54581 type:complete len:299 (+) Transcript_24005:70-966(+)|eukprot:CAMPEP_0181257618 /NCGR_PEP_ID=MMETSP1096-20121128/50341_1 /TAXON_ID=156174 ORGANISM="Chrysochromulina ericina, Strain CCMP281" /NCGR_SAMPLE_ID=MMETSP1096 /ASSEMBLY_ACC=CAM_ASM_000453 /LENGTH=298 /DNA_ID=CAMNT_0023355949 /DNA_START=47 /DNA_END=943 /DNA_ORIENTATION=+